QLRPPPTPPPFPYTTLFRSVAAQPRAHGLDRAHADDRRGQSERESGAAFRDPVVDRRAREERHGYSCNRPYESGDNAENHQMRVDRKSTRLNSSHVAISYAV